MWAKSLTWYVILRTYTRNIVRTWHEYLWLTPARREEFRLNISVLPEQCCCQRSVVDTASLFNSGHDVNRTVQSSAHATPACDLYLCLSTKLLFRLILPPYHFLLLFCDFFGDAIRFVILQPTPLCCQAVTTNYLVDRPRNLEKSATSRLAESIWPVRSIYPGASL